MILFPRAQTNGIWIRITTASVFFAILFCLEMLFPVPAIAAGSDIPVPDLTAEWNGTCLVFSWEKNDALDGYRIYRTDPEGSVHMLMKTTQENSWQLEGLARGRSYHFQLRGYTRAAAKDVWTAWGTPVEVAVPKDGPDPETRLRFGNMLSVMHADNYGSLERVRQAALEQYYAVECDYNYSDGVMWCYHDYITDATGTLEQSVEICKENGTRVVVDMKNTSDEALGVLAQYIKDNRLEKWVIIQTNSLYSMEYLNAIAGSTLEYWGLVMDNYATVDDLTYNAETYKAAGMTTVNIPKYVSGSSYTLGTLDTVRTLIDAGYDICVFTWGDFSDWEVSEYSSYGAGYLMTNSVTQAQDLNG